MLDGAPGPARLAYVARVVGIMGDRLRLPEDVQTYGAFFFTDDLTYEDAEVRKYLDSDEVLGLLDRVAEALASAPEFSRDAVEQAIHAAVPPLTFKAAARPLRYAVTAQHIGPGLFELIEVLGRERAVARLRGAASCVRSLRASSAPPA